MSAVLPVDIPDELVWQVLNTASIGLIVTDPDRRILYVNATFEEETGYTAEEVRGRPCSFLQGPETDPADVAALREALNQAQPVERVILNYRKDGSPLWYKVRIRPLHVAGVLRYFVGVQEDFTLAHTAQVELQRLAYLDSLTGLGNRRAFDVHVRHAVQAVQATRLFVLDLNEFKQVNDTRGHAAGDVLLAQVGACLNELAQGRGHAYRLGGDEFAVLIPDLGSAAALFETRLLETLQALDGSTLRISVGSAGFPAEAADGGAWLRLADRRMYAHKATKAR
ncbi:diguanylate cyclase [Deinococcus sp. Arct2-2]|uniref:sensor domain-containing diguanylate cyclase n=1 Tax=Deinococcus sp. Arct2-2 TaxID=2568653 RepID=UPI0010A4BEF4|nr:GGDEF domain-containing protein [Deinococcus sp. Arct2-2]THF66688.1 diguanylate cyclase [Deinococcus sp. Arct2-2]